MQSTRTTLTLESDVFTGVKTYTHQQQISFKAAINQLIRLGILSTHKKSTIVPQKRIKLKTFDFGLKPEYRNVNFNHLADELEDEAIMQKLNLP